MTQTYHEIKEQLLDAALSHVPFDGWSETAFQAAIRDTGIQPTMAKAVYPRGAVDLAIAYHQRGDRLMIEALSQTDLAPMRFRDRIAMAIKLRLECVEDKEVVRRGTTLFALPQHAGEGAKLIWGTADAIWNALGDSSEDVNWYTKRATLSAVYSATVLFWLGDNEYDHAPTWAFLDRRIEDVMQIEKAKAHIRQNPVLSKIMSGPNWLIGQIKAPQKQNESNLPGRWNTPQ